MRVLKEKVPKEGVSPSMALLVIAVAGTAILSIGAITPAAVFAQEAIGNDGHGTPRQNPGQQEDANCWGDVTKQLAQIDDGQAGLGHHASSFDEPRLGVGNQPGDDTRAIHGDNVGDMNRPPLDCLD